jgi:FkbM family methyltransferase
VTPSGQVDAVAPTLRESTVAAVTRLYPLKSGCGPLATSGLVRALSGDRAVKLWAPVAGRTALVPTDDLVGRSMFYVGDLDPKVSWAVRQFARKGDVALDIGTNLGLVMLQLAAQVGPSGRVHAFEPNPAMLAFLDATLARNADLPVTLHRVALGRDEAMLPLSVPAVNAGAASFVDNGGRAVAYRVDVPVRRLDAFAAEHGIDRVDFIKIDVEGFEAEVLQGGRDLIRRLRPRAIVLEEQRPVTEAGLPKSLAILKEAGYAIHALPKRLLKVEMVPLDRLQGETANDFVAVLGA